MHSAWKKIAAGVATVAMCAIGFAGTSSAFAEDTGSTGTSTSQTPTAATYTITINSTEAGHTYNAYQIFAGDYALVNGARVLSNVTWGDGLTAAGQQALLKQFNVTTPAALAELMASKSFTDAQLNEFSKIAGENLSTTVAGTASTLGTSGYVISGLPAGYYLVNDQSSTLTDENKAYTGYIIQVLGDATVTPKSSVPSVDKKVQDEKNDAEAGSDADGWGDSADHAINENFQFKVTANIPADPTRDMYQHPYRVQFNDTMTAGITYGSISSVQISYAGADGKTVTQTVPEGSYTVSTSTVTDGQPTTLTINIPSLRAAAGLDATASIGGAFTITVIYNAHLNENAQVLQQPGAITNTNTVNLQFSNNPYVQGSLGKTPDKTVYVASFQLNGTKHAGSETGPALAGAQFQLFEADGTTQIPVYKSGDFYYPVANTENAPVNMVSGTDGQFNIKGLDAGTYVVKEVVTPAGYNTMDPVTIVISATHLQGNVTALTATVNNEPGSLNVDYVNTTGAELPSTGGQGLRMFYTVGAAIVLIAGAGLVVALMRRRKVNGR
ncbi:isopeptide-forming domain-containing fimbrial protein [uncultured Bifidobacterium sp.]|uniref:isopeptide-forming domain-containing fimbrial protein n=1 Tax=uncultured Bifidobacterium sp. TaxID=165187 RepID=UPI002599CFC8|nr:isopeptide-forming domain-containing fimbrial protein [uncultured Bifidobacterium sp.]